MSESNLDIEVFEKLFISFQPRLFAYCMKFIDDRDLAQDFVQESFVNLWNNRDQITAVSYNSYLFKSIHNRCISHFRSMKVQIEYQKDCKYKIDSMAIQPEVSSTLTQLYMSEVNELIERSVERLPPKCRQIFEMSRFRHLSNKEIAQELDLSVRTIEAQLYNALKILREDLKDYLPLIILFYPDFF